MTYLIDYNTTQSRVLYLSADYQRLNKSHRAAQQKIGRHRVVGCGHRVNKALKKKYARNLNQATERKGQAYSPEKKKKKMGPVEQKTESVLPTKPI